MAQHWIANAVKNKGALHSHLKVAQGEKIPEEKLRAAQHSKNPAIRREAALAATLKGFHHKAKGQSLGKNVIRHLYTASGSKG